METKISKDTKLKEVLKLAAPCRCNSCSTGCKYGSGFLIGDDAENISKFLKVTKKELEEKYLEEAEQFSRKLWRPKLLRKAGKPYGKCIFYDEERGCTIHPVKPLQCKTSIACKPYGKELSLWFMHNYIIDENDENSMKEYEIYLKSGGEKLD